jgi:hypothetical protein
MSTIRSVRRLALAVALAVTLAVAVVVGAASPAEAGKRPDLLLQGGDRWFTHDVGYPVVLGPAEVDLGHRTVTGELAASFQPNDGTMPAPGACEDALAFVFVEGDRGANLFLSSAGEVCGQHLQAPNVVTHVFTGVMTIEESDKRNLEGVEGFLEIRLAVDGRGTVFATTW